MSKSHVVSILNQKLVVRSDASDESVEEIAQAVSARVQQVLDATKSASLLTAALLVCLNMADEISRLKASKGVANVRAAQKVREMIQLVDSQLEEAAQMAL